jgi:N-acyl-D-aspartate/D-glutamate deacylase
MGFDVPNHCPARFYIECPHETASARPDCRVRSATAADRTIAIVGAVLIDGSGSAPQAGSIVVIRGDHIVSVRPETPPPDAEIINARGRVLAPGFIDMHNQSDHAMQDDPTLATQVSQGITTIVVG